MVGGKVDGQLLFDAKSEKWKNVFGARSEKRKNFLVPVAKCKNLFDACDKL